MYLQSVTLDTAKTSLVRRIFRGLTFPKKSQASFVQYYIDLKGSNYSDREAITMMKEIYSNTIGESSPEVSVCEEMLEQLKMGRGIVAAMKGWFNQEFLLVFEAALNVPSSQTAEIVDKYMYTIERISSIKKGVWNKLLIPAVLLIASTGVLVGVGGYVIPIVMTLIEKEVSMFSVDAVTFISEFIMKAYPYLIGLLIISIASYAYFVGNYVGNYRTVLDKSIFVIPKKIASARFFGMLSLLLSTRMSLRACLETLSGKNNQFIEWHIANMLENTKQGISEMKQLDTGLLDERLKIRLEVSGKKNSSTNDESLKIISEHSLSDVNESLKMISGSIAFVLWVSLVIVFASSFFALLDAMILVYKFTS